MVRHLTVAGEAMNSEIAYTVQLAVILPVYAVVWGWRNFLWFSDIALIATGITLWLDSALLASMMALAVLLPELLWSASYFGRLLFCLHVSDLAGHVFDARKPRCVRALSLFHVALPAVLIWSMPPAEPPPSLLTRAASPA